MCIYIYIKKINVDGRDNMHAEFNFVSHLKGTEQRSHRVCGEGDSISTPVEVAPFISYLHLSPPHTNRPEKISFMKETLRALAEFDVAVRTRAS